MKTLAVLISLTVLVVTVAGQDTGTYFGAITCTQDSRVSGCNTGNTCTVTCPPGCGNENLTKLGWGTSNYSYDTLLCRAAVHNYRMTSYSSDYNLTYVRVGVDLEKYLSTIQLSIQSTTYKKLYYSPYGYYYFTTPYITEDILDIATLNYNSLYQPNGQFLQGCYDHFGSGQYNPKSFEYYIPRSGRRNSETNVEGSDEVLEEISWTSPQLKPGGYMCNPVNNTYSNIMSLAMPSDADFRPDQWTLTKSIGQNVTIHFTATQPGNNSVTWRKDQNTLYSFPNMILSSTNASDYYLEIDNLQFGDGGVYSLEVSGQQSKQGIMRLIIRRCGDNMFGSNCDQTCPICQNGGVCHDVMGTCICAPGFNGTNCESACNENLFGQTCELDCKWSDNAIGDGTCNGALICLPDPYGCSCAPGRSGLECALCLRDSDCPSDKKCVQMDCADACSPAACGPNAICTADNHQPICACPPNYSGDPQNQTTGCQAMSSDVCQGDSDCTSDQICSTTTAGIKDCIDACSPAACGPNAICTVDNHQPICACPANYSGDPQDQTTGCQEGGGSTDCGDTLDTALHDALQSNSFNPSYHIPKMRLNLWLNRPTFYNGLAWNLKNLMRTGDCTVTNQGGHSVDTMRIGGNNIIITGRLSSNGLLGTSQNSNLMIGVVIQSFDSMLTVETDSTPKLVGFKLLQLGGVRVMVQSGNGNMDQLTNTLITILQKFIPTLLNGVINFILISIFANLVPNLSL